MKKLKENEETMIISLCVPVSLNERLEEMASKSKILNTKSKVIRHMIETKLIEIELSVAGMSHGG